MNNVWMEEAARNFGTQIREEGLNKTQTRKLTGLSEKKTRELHNFIMNLTESEFENLTQPEAVETEAAEDITNNEDGNALYRLARLVRREKATDEQTDFLVDLAMQTIYAMSGELERIHREESLEFVALEDAGYKWISMRFEADEEDYDAVKAILAAQYKEHGKRAMAKIYKEYKVVTDENTIRFTIQVSTKNL